MKQPMIDYIKKPKYDEFFTPVYAIKPILKYLKPNSTIWCPFDKKDSNYVKVLEANGHNVIATHIDDGFDFFDYYPIEFQDGSIYIPTEPKNTTVNGDIKLFKPDYIISNPPYSIKNKILKHLYELGIPFLMLLPITTVVTSERQELFKKHGIEIIFFDIRINFLTNKNSNWFDTAYFCWNVLPEKIVFEEINKKIKEHK